MKCTKQSFAMVVGLIACTLLAPSLAQLGRGGQPNRPRTCHSDRIIRTNDGACCAFNIMTRNSSKGSPVTTIKAVGRVVAQTVIQQKFILTVADAGLDVEKDTFLTQAAGQDVLFVCPPGTQLVVAERRAPGRRRKMNISRVLRLLRSAAGFFGVRRPPTPSPAEEEGKPEVVQARAPAPAAAAEEAVAVEEAKANTEELDDVASEVMQNMLSEMLNDDRIFK